MNVAPTFVVKALDGDWSIQALCAQTDPELFYPDDQRNSGPAKAVCGRCEVLEMCREWALETGETQGVWGGMTPSERRRETERRLSVAA